MLRHMTYECGPTEGIDIQVRPAVTEALQQYLRGRVPQHADQGRIDRNEASRRGALEDTLDRVLENTAIFLFRLPQVLLGLASGVTEVVLCQCLPDGLSQACEPVFEQVIRRAVRHTLHGHFLAEVPTDNDEWHVQPAL